MNNQLISQLNNAAKAPAEDWGKTIKLICKIICITVAYIMVITFDIARIMYCSGYAFGQWIHQLNNAFTQLTAKGIVRKSTQTQQDIDPWQLQLPLPQSIGSWLVSTSRTTRTISASKMQNPPLLHGTKLACVTVAAKKEAGTTSKAGPSNKSVSSPRSKPSVKRSSSTKKPCKTQEKNVTTSDGTPSQSTTRQRGRNRTQRSVPTTAKEST